MTGRSAPISAAAPLSKIYRTRSEWEENERRREQFRAKLKEKTLADGQPPAKEDAVIH